MGSGQSTGEGEREVTVEEREGEDGPQIIVTQDFLEYVHEKQDEEEGEGGGRRERRNRPPPPPYPGDEEGDDIPHLTTSDMISSALPGSGGRRRDDSVWQKKYELEREKNWDLKHATDSEFVKTVGEIREKFAEAEVLDMLPACEEMRNEVLRCYQSNPGKPLLCSGETKAFSLCVERARQKLLQAK